MPFTRTLTGGSGRGALGERLEMVLAIGEVPTGQPALPIWSVADYDRTWFDLAAVAMTRLSR